MHTNGLWARYCHYLIPICPFPAYCRGKSTGQLSALIFWHQCCVMVLMQLSCLCSACQCTRFPSPPVLGLHGTAASFTAIFICLVAIWTCNRTWSGWPSKLALVCLHPFAHVPLLPGHALITLHLSISNFPVPPDGPCCHHLQYVWESSRNINRYIKIATGTRWGRCASQCWICSVVECWTLLILLNAFQTLDKSRSCTPVTIADQSWAFVSVQDLVNCSPDTMPGFDEKIKMFYEEHIHADEEIRFVLDGSGTVLIHLGPCSWILSCHICPNKAKHSPNRHQITAVSPLQKAASCSAVVMTCGQQNFVILLCSSMHAAELHCCTNKRASSLQQTAYKTRLWLPLHLLDDAHCVGIVWLLACSLCPYLCSSFSIPNYRITCKIPSATPTNNLLKMLTATFACQRFRATQVVNSLCNCSNYHHTLVRSFVVLQDEAVRPFSVHGSKFKSSFGLFWILVLAWSVWLYTTRMQTLPFILLQWPRPFGIHSML